MAFKIASFWRPVTPRNFQFQSCLDTSLLAVVSSLDEYEKFRLYDNGSIRRKCNRRHRL
jgi:hypothetical protein